MAHTCETTVNKYVHQKISDIQNSALPYFLLESMGQVVDQLELSKYNGNYPQMTWILLPTLRSISMGYNQ